MMIRLKVGLRCKTHKPINKNYVNYLRSFCCNCIGKKPNEPCPFLLTGGGLDDKVEISQEIVAFSPFQGENYEIQDNIAFKDDVSWYIDCSSYEKITKLIQELHQLGSICIENEEFEISSIELQ